jgi:hypothetical protein
MLLQAPSLIKLRQFTSAHTREFAERTNQEAVTNQWTFKTADLITNGPWHEDFFLKHTTTTRQDGSTAHWQETPDTIIYYGEQQFEWFTQATFSPLTKLIGITPHGRVHFKNNQDTNIPTPPPN